MGTRKEFASYPRVWQMESSLYIVTVEIKPVDIEQGAKQMCLHAVVHSTAIDSFLTEAFSPSVYWTPVIHGWRDRESPRVDTGSDSVWCCPLYLVSEA